MSRFKCTSYIHVYNIREDGTENSSCHSSSKNKNGPVLVAEYSNTDISANEAEKEARKRVVEMAKNRKREIEGEIIVKSAEHIVKKCGCALAIIVEVE